MHVVLRVESRPWKHLCNDDPFKGYENSVEKLGGKKIQGRMLVYENLPSPYSGAILFSKVNMGLEKLIDKKDWAEVEDPTRSG